MTSAVKRPAKTSACPKQLVNLHKIITKQQMAVTVERNNAQTIKNQYADLEAEYNGLKVQNSQTARELKAAQVEVGMLSGKLIRLAELGFNLDQILGPGYVANQPAISGKVLAVRNDVGLVMLSVGTQNQVQPGFKFVVSNGAEYKAQVQVDKVYNDMSSAKIIAETVKAGTTIEPNDDAVTRSK